MVEMIIVLVTYNGKEYTEKCIQSILASTYKNFRIVLIDNCSADDTPEYLKSKFKDEIDVICNSDNLGFAEANNIGVNYGMKYDPRYILLLNNDTEIDPLMLEDLVKKAEENSNAVIVPKIYYYAERNRIWYAGGVLNKKKGRTDHIGIAEIDKGQYDEAKTVGFASGCCMLIPVDIYKQIGLFDAKYFMYYEDADFSARVIRNNYKILYEPAAKLWHKVSSTSGSGTSKFQVYYTSRNRLYFITRNRDIFNIASMIHAWLFVICRGAKGFLLRTDAIAAWYALYDYCHQKLGKTERCLK